MDTLLLLILIAFIGTASSSIVWRHYMNQYAVAEDAKRNDIVYTLKAEDVVNGVVNTRSTILYGVRGEGSIPFLVNITSGDVIVYLPGLLDRELNKEVTVTFVAYIAGTTNEESEIAATIVIKDVNDSPPQFQQTTYSTTLDENVPIGTTVIFNMYVSDLDVTINSQSNQIEVTCNKTKAEELLLQNICDIFSVTKVRSSNIEWLGQIILSQPLDYEDVRTVPRNRYQIPLTATDGIHWTDQSVEVFVNDIQDTPPTFTRAGPTFVVNESFPAFQNINYVKAVDQDLGSPRQIYYEIIGNPGYLYDIDPRSGFIWPKMELDLDNPIIQPTMDIVIKAREILNTTTLALGDDALTTATSLVQVVIRDINDNKPNFEFSEYRTKIYEDIANDTALPNIRISVDDKDSIPNNKYAVLIEFTDVFKLAGTTTSVIGKSTITILVKNTALIDYENGPRNYTLMIVALETDTSERYSSSAMVYIEVLDVNDNSPKFFQRSYVENIAESTPVGTLVTILTATDTDSKLFGTDGIRYELDGPGNDRFQINPISGAVTVKSCFEPSAFIGCLDYEAVPNYQLRVIARDNVGTGIPVPVDMIIDIIDENDNAPVFGPKSYSSCIKEGNLISSPAVSVKATDRDKVGGPLTFTFVAEDVPGLWRIDRLGNITASRPIKYQDTLQMKGFFLMTVQVTDGKFTDVANVRIDVAVTLTCPNMVCPPGKEDTGLGSCTPCQQGFFKSDYTAANCTACPAQTTTVGEGETSSSSCSLRVYLASSSNAFDSGAHGYLNCTVVGEGVSNLSWYYEEHKIVQSKYSRIQLKDIFSASAGSVSSTLNFQPVQESDAGLYDCVGSSTAGMAIHMGRVPLNVNLVPKIIIFPLRQTVEMGSNVSLTCSLVSNATRISYNWYQDDNKIHSESKYSDSHGSRLDIINAVRSSTYLCSGNDSAVVMNASANIDIRTNYYCKTNTDLRGIIWDVTNGGVISTQSCQSGSTGTATRFCNANGTWEGANYDQCVSITLMHLINEVEKLRDGILVTNVSTILEMTKTATLNELVPKELETVVSLLNHITDIKDNVTDFKDSYNATKNFMETASNIVDEITRTSWQTLKSKNGRGAEIVLNTIDNFFKGNSICSLQTNESRIQTKNIDVKIGCQLPADLQASKNDESLKDLNDALYFPIQEGTNYTYTAVLYNNLSGMLQNKILQDGNIKNGSFDVGPVVMSLQLDPQPKLNKLAMPLELMFQFFHSQYTNPVCSFWTFNATGNGEGAWSSDGCSIKVQNASGFVCECSHLTNFAILMTLSEVLDPTHDARLSIISVVGCAISIKSLLLTIIGHVQVWKYVKSKRTNILLNICVALLISYGIFLAGVNRTDNKIACTVIAACLHYFYLAVFFIMLVEGIEIAVSTLYVFPTRSRRKWLLPLAWIIPGGIVGVSLGISRLHGYGNDRFCWLSVQHGLIWAFVGPVALIIAINVVIIVIVIRKMFTLSAVIKKERKEKIKTSLRSLGVLLPITGVTWVFGILSVNEDTVVFQYLFTIFNSLQGLFIFIFHCLLNKQIHNAVKLKIRLRRMSDMSATTLRTASREERNGSQEEQEFPAFQGPSVRL